MKRQLIIWCSQKKPLHENFWRTCPTGKDEPPESWEICAVLVKKRMIALKLLTQTLLLVGLCWLPGVFTAEKDNQWMIDEVLGVRLKSLTCCRWSVGNLLQVIPNLLRFNAKGEMVSSDLSEYIVFNCTGHGKDRSCKLDQENLKVTEIQELYSPSTGDNIQSYASVRFMWECAFSVCECLKFFLYCVSQLL